MTTDDMKSRAKGLIAKIPNSLLVTVDADGYPAGRLMSTAKVADDFTVYYATGRDSNKCRQIAANTKVAVSWVTGDSYVVLKGEAVVTDDQQVRDMLWQDSFTPYFPGGRTDPNYVVVRVAPKELRVES